MQNTLMLILTVKPPKTGKIAINIKNMYNTQTSPAAHFISKNTMTNYFGFQKLILRSITDKIYLYLKIAQYGTDRKLSPDKNGGT